MEKRIEFNDDVVLREFDCNKPVFTASSKVRNFIEHNKKKIRSRSKNKHPANHEIAVFNQRHGSVSSATFDSRKKKPTLKNFNSLMNEEMEFYEA